MAVVLGEHLDVLLGRVEVHLVGDDQRGLYQGQEVACEPDRLVEAPLLEGQFVQPRDVKGLCNLGQSGLDP